MSGLIGFPNPQHLAEEIASEGFRSCSDAETAGYTVTWHPETREKVDQIVTKLWQEVDAKF